MLAKLHITYPYFLFCSCGISAVLIATTVGIIIGAIALIIRAMFEMKATCDALTVFVLNIKSSITCCCEKKFT